METSIAGATVRSLCVITSCVLVTLVNILIAFVNIYDEIVLKYDHGKPTINMLMWKVCNETPVTTTAKSIAKKQS